VTPAWTPARAEDYLLGLELFGMRFGLERMRRLMTALGSPERAFASVHVVGTNGKSSTVRMIAEVLERHGVRSGAYLSPHLASFTERIRVGGRDLEPGAFAAAVQRAARAAALVNRTLPAGEEVTQFEALTAAAYSELAAREVEVAVVEAGLGGRWDATNVIPSRVQVLTNVGLEHTRWLGPTIADIAREKLDVVRAGGTLVVGALHPEAEAQARAAAQACGARLVHAPDEVEGVALAARGAFQRANFALAATASRAFLGRLDGAALRAAGAAVTIPGRCEAIDRDPLTIADGAHNPAGMAALVASLPELRGAQAGGAVVAVVSILEDKDAAGMLRELLPSCSAVVLTSNSNPRALPPPTLQSLASQVAPEPPPRLEVEADPRAAVRRARELAGRDGAVLVTGSIYLVASVTRADRGRRASTL
jgi:dihydrofolate synthase/folylpolyglutamate synthase